MRRSTVSLLLVIVLVCCCSSVEILSSPAPAPAPAPGGRRRRRHNDNAPPQTTLNGLCNGLAEACKLPFNQMSFVGAHNACGKDYECLNGQGILKNNCGWGVLVGGCAYDNQDYSLMDLMQFGLFINVFFFFPTRFYKILN